MIYIIIIWIGIDGQELGRTKITRIGDITWTVPEGTMVARLRFSETAEIELPYGTQKENNEPTQGPKEIGKIWPS